MTKIAANSMKCASVNGSAHTAVVHIAGNEAIPEEEDHETPPVTQSGSTSGSTPKTKTASK